MSSMPYRMLGNTGLQVSVLSFGFWATYGVKEGLTGDEGVEERVVLEQELLVRVGDRDGGDAPGG